MKDGFIKVAAYSPRVAVGDPAANAQTAIGAMQRAEREGAKLLVLPELFLSGYTCADLFFQTALQSACVTALGDVLAATADCGVMAVLGLPLAFGNRLYNCAAVVYRGELLGVVPKTNIPDYNEFYEGRYFAPAPSENYAITLCGFDVLFGTKQIFTLSGIPLFKLAVEICEDLWVTVPPSAAHAAAGATVVANLSASSAVIGKSEYRRLLVTSQSARCVCGYVYATAAAGESSTDLVFSGNNMIAEDGAVLAESRPFAPDNFLCTEIDCEKLAGERQKQNTFGAFHADGYAYIERASETEETKLTRFVDKHPFVPARKDEKDCRCDLILDIQAHGLARRIEAAYAKALVIGISGGLDSCLALLVAVRACELLGRPMTDIHAVTMPCFGTTKRTRTNAEILCRALGTTFEEIDIKASVDQHFSDIGQDPKKHDVTYENSQARERTQILMDIANKEGGMVVGTGDLSELALGFATYNGDHMSMYGVNASVPKTLVRHIVCRSAEKYEAAGKEELAAALYDIYNTPVSPELLPPKDGEIAQVTEDIVGPYELHDFFLYHFVRFGARPRKIFRLACYAFDGEYDAQTIAKWLSMFVRRFFAQQFKRSCLPDGPKVGTVSLAPRGDFRMPSDASAAAFRKEAEEILEEVKITR